MKMFWICLWTISPRRMRSDDNNRNRQINGLPDIDAGTKSICRFLRYGISRFLDVHLLSIAPSLRGDAIGPNRPALLTTAASDGEFKI